MSSLAWFGYRTPNVYATCGTGASIALINPVTGATVHGIFQLSAGTSSTALPQPSGVTFTVTAPTALVVGNATMATSGQTITWSFPWDTTTLPDGSYQMAAIAHYGVDPASDCTSSPTALTVQNTTSGGTQTPSLAVSVTPNTWNGLPGQTAPFAVSGTYKNQFGTAYPVGSTSSGAVVVWSTNAGSLGSSNTPTTNFTAGPLPGNYLLTAKVTMNNVSATATAALRINSTSVSGGSTPLSPSPSPSSTRTAPPSPFDATDPPSLIGVDGTAPLTAQQIQKLTATPTVFRPMTPTNSAPIVSVPILGCLQAKIGDNFAAISDGMVQPTASDRLKASTCFSGSDKIPASIAPVAPAHITEVATSKDFVKLDSIKNATITNADGKKIAVLLLSGTSVPNSSVFLYFFSDPMVLRAETDGSGNYNYVLQNPLVPGKHEVYAVAAKDAASFVRTQALPITIAAAASSGQNGSLVIESKLQPVQVGFIIASILMVLAAAMILLRMVRRTKPVMAAPTVSYAPISTAMPSPVDAAPHQIGTVFMPQTSKDSPLVQPPADNQPHG